MRELINIVIYMMKKNCNVKIVELNLKKFLILGIMIVKLKLYI